MREVIISIEPWTPPPYYYTAILTDKVSWLVDDMGIGKCFSFKGRPIKLEKGTIVTGFYSAI